jgi:signal transduction histidine kinase
MVVLQIGRCGRAAGATLRAGGHVAGLVSRRKVGIETEGANLHLSIRDDGIGGADAAKGSGLIGPTDRVEALGGTLTVISPPGQGTSLQAELPLSG